MATFTDFYQAHVLGASVTHEKVQLSLPSATVTSVSHGGVHRQGVVTWTVEQGWDRNSPGEHLSGEFLAFLVSSLTCPHLCCLNRLARAVYIHECVNRFAETLPRTVTYWHEGPLLPSTAVTYWHEGALVAGEKIRRTIKVPLSGQARITEDYSIRNDGPRLSGHFDRLAVSQARDERLR